MIAKPSFAALTITLTQKHRNTETQKHRNTETQKHSDNTASLCFCVIAVLSLCYRCVIAVLSLCCCCVIAVLLHGCSWNQPFFEWFINQPCKAWFLNHAQLISTKKSRGLAKLRFATRDCFACSLSFLLLLLLTLALLGQAKLGFARHSQEFCNKKAFFKNYHHK